MKDSELLRLAEEFGTPLYVFDTDLLKTRMEQIRDIIPGEIDICYSVKANPLLIPAMNALVRCFEVCSPGELEICEALKVSGERIIYSGVNKGAEDIREAIRYGAGMLTAESKHHAELLNQEAAGLNKTIPVLLRLSGGNQFGMSKEDLFRLLSHTGDTPALQFKGIHYFMGTGRKKLSHREKELGMLSDLYREIRDRFGIKPECLEYGPGLPYPYFENEDFSDTLLPLKELVPLLGKMTEITHVTVEMGRFFVSECGCYLTRIEDVKKDGEARYCIVDGGINHVNYYGQMMGMYRPLIRHFSSAGEPKRDTSEKEHFTLCGSLCTTADVLVRDCPLAKPDIGDVLAFYNIGAYSVTEGMYLFLSRELPAVVTYSADGGAHCVRGRVRSSEINLPQSRL
ncbi:MAG: alanine racemase [Lachnospiraceae bacterium]|nr:alanine racemase [Lachnospiraceae bacterium]